MVSRYVERRRQPTPEIQQKVTPLSAGLSIRDEIEAMAVFVQHDVR